MLFSMPHNMPPLIPIYNTAIDAKKSHNKNVERLDQENKTGESKPGYLLTLKNKENC